MSRRALSFVLALLALALALALAIGSGCRRAPPPQVDIYAQPGKDRLAQLQIDAGRGDRVAQNQLALRYFGGDGLPKDEAKALYWWQAAAAQGDDDAQATL